MKVAVAYPGTPSTEILENIQALDAKFEFVKLNTVLMRKVNEDEIWPLIRFSSENGVPLRLIELMPLTSREVLTPENFLSIGEVIRWLKQRERLIPMPDARLGHGPARNYRLAKSGAVVGFIGAMTNQHFCETLRRFAALGPDPQDGLGFVLGRVGGAGRARSFGFRAV